MLAVGLVFGQLFARPTVLGSAGYMSFFAAGFILWQLISATVLEGCLVFVSNGPLIKAMPLPLHVHVLRMMGRNIILFGHNTIILLLLWLSFQWPLKWTVLLVLPGLLLIGLALLGAVLALAVLCARFRDVQPIIQSLLQLLFLVTPVLWPPEAIADRSARILLDLNPFYYLIEVVRGPTLGQGTPVSVWVGATAISVMSLVFGLLLFRRYQARIPYWI